MIRKNNCFSLQKNFSSQKAKKDIKNEKFLITPLNLFSDLSYKSIIFSIIFYPIIKLSLREEKLPWNSGGALQT